MTDFYVLTRYRAIKEAEESEMYEPTRKELWAVFGMWAVSMGFACAVGWVAWHMGSALYHALVQFAQKVGLVG